MIHQSPARIYKSQQRGLIENALHRLYATFTFEGYAEASRSAFGNLNVLNDETLAPGQELKRQTDNNTAVLLIPLVGALEYGTTGTTNTIVAGEAAVISNTDITLTNPYEDSRINYLYVTFFGFVPEDSVYTFNQNIKNTLQPLLTHVNLKGYIGLFNGREEAIYKCSNPANGLFIFVINGAFEVQGRLLENRDGLALWDTPEAELEALSENAILLLFELPLNRLTA